MKKKLEMNGLQITTVNNGRDLVKMYKNSLDKYGKSEYDLIITDINMPTLNGDKATTEIRRMEQDNGILHRNRIPIIALSGDGSKEDIFYFLKSQMTDYFIKGGDPELLTKIVASYLTKIKNYEYGPDSNKLGDALSIDETKNTTQLLSEDHSKNTNNSDIIDLKKLSSLTNGSIEENKNILKYFLRDGKKLAIKIKQNYQDQDIANLRLNIHALKGISSSIGANSLFKFCQNLGNELRKKNDFPKNQNWINDFYLEYKRLVEQIKVIIKRTAPIC